MRPSAGWPSLFALSLGASLLGCPLTDDYELAGAGGAGAGTASGSVSSGVGGSGDDAGAGASGSTTSTTGVGGAGGASTTTTGVGGDACTFEPTAPSPDCPLDCDACEAGTCVIRCDTFEQCRLQVVNCPEGRPCRIECSAERACEDATLLCPDDGYACDVACAAKDACRLADLVCGAGVCDVACGLEAACKDSKLFCGPHACTATCAGSDPPDLMGCAADCGCTPCEDD